MQRIQETELQAQEIVGAAFIADVHRAEAIIILNAAWMMIDDMVNFALFMPFEEVVDVQLVARTADALRLFHVLIGDFLSTLVAKGSQRPSVRLAEAAVGRAAIGSHLPFLSSPGLRSTAAEFAFKRNPGASRSLCGVARSDQRGRGCLAALHRGVCRDIPPQV